MGIETTQATISRDIHTIGAVKGPYGYCLPGVTPGTELPPPAPASTKTAEGAIGTFAIEITRAAALVVIHTAPGHAQLVALELDRHREPPVMGTVAGDDTIFIATPSEKDARELCARLRRNAGLDAPETRSSEHAHAVPDQQNGNP